MPDETRESVLGIIGGSGIYEIQGLEDERWERVESPFGDPSDELLLGCLGDTRLAFLPRHGRGHRIPPGEINYRANIDAMKRIGVTDLISLGACGSLREELSPGTFVLVDQFVDRTVAREKTFFTRGCVAHVSMAKPTCGRLGKMLAQSASALSISYRQGGVYLAMEGPQFSSFAESQLYRSWGCDVIGMTNMPEAKLAREAELCYASVAMITDYDSWHPDHGEVDVTEIIKTLMGNADKARNLVKELPALLGAEREDCPHGCDKALEFAILTAPDARDPAVLAKLDAVAGRVLNA